MNTGNIQAGVTALRVYWKAVYELRCVCTVYIKRKIGYDKGLRLSLDARSERKLSERCARNSKMK